MIPNRLGATGDVFSVAEDKAYGEIRKDNVPMQNWQIVPFMASTGSDPELCIGICLMLKILRANRSTIVDYNHWRKPELF